MHLWLPMLLASVLAGAGTYGVLARRNAVLVLIGVELILNAANVMLVTLGAADDSPLQTGQSLTLFIITIAAAEICVALAVILAMFKLQGHIDLSAATAADLAGRRGGEPVTVLTTTTVQLLVLLPALGALAGLLLRRRRAFSGLVAVAAAALAFVLSVFQFAETAGRSDVVPTFGPLPVGELQIPLTCSPTAPPRSSPSRWRSSGWRCRCSRSGTCATTPATPSSRPRSPSSWPPCCSSSSRTTSCSRWSAGRSWAGAPTSSSATSARASRRGEPPTRPSSSRGWPTSGSSSAW